MSFYSTDLQSHDQVNKAEAAPLKQPTRYRKTFKRMFDLVMVLSTAWFTLPVILILVVAVLVTGQAPFYIQDRVGLNGKIFRIWKLQTMLPNAKERLEAYLTANPEMREEWDSKQKLTNDPRITPIGNFLRKTSLDELPQLFNVLNGTMSLIGPRPMMPEQREQYDGTAYYRLLPGMSGMWQVSDRSDGDFVGRVAYDEAYDQEVSFKTDVTLVFKTVGVILRGTGI